MAFISSLTLYLLATSFTFGQLLRLNIFHINLPLVDVLTVLLAITNIISHYQTHSLHPKNRNWLIFLILAWIILFVNLFLLRLPPLKPIFYLVRFSSLLSLLVWPPATNPPLFQHFFILALISNIIFGFIQYFLWPDFTYFSALNWDPHLYRLVSTFFDPTFTALIYLFLIIKIYFINTKSNFWKYLLLLAIYIALSLTYSRSGYLAFIIAFGYIAITNRKPRVFLISLTLIIVSVSLLPRLPGEGTKLERTSSIKAKIINYQEGVKLYLTSPIIGFGYNTLGLIRPNTKGNSHANFGFDSSLLTILVTNGIIGFYFFITGLKKYWVYSPPYHRALLIAVMCHSLFSNSLLYPWILLFMILT